MRPPLNFKIFHLVRVIFELQAHQAVLLIQLHSTQTFSADKDCTRLLSIEIREFGLTFVSVYISSGQTHIKVKRYLRDGSSSWTSPSCFFHLGPRAFSRCRGINNTKYLQINQTIG